MKRRVVIASFAALSMLVIGFGIFKSSASEGSPKLSIDDIKQIVSSQYPGMIEEVELEMIANQAVYEVELMSDGHEYELTLDGNTGEILHLKNKRSRKKEADKLMADDIDGQPEEENQVGSEQTGEAHKGKPRNSNESNNKSTSPKNTVIDTREALKIAQSQFSGVVTELELQTSHGRLIYEIELLSESGEEAELEIDAYTGEVLVIELDMKHHLKHKNRLGDLEAFISAQQVLDRIEKSFDGFVKELHLEADDGRLIYEVELLAGDQEIEVEVDAYSGEVISVDLDD